MRISFNGREIFNDPYSAEDLANELDYFVDYTLKIKKLRSQGFNVIENVPFEVLDQSTDLECI